MSLRALSNNHRYHISSNKIGFQLGRKKERNDICQHFKRYKKEKKLWYTIDEKTFENKTTSFTDGGIMGVL